MATQLTLTNGGLLMSITVSQRTVSVDKKIATGLLGKAKTGDELLSVLDMIIDSFTKPALATPTLEEIEF
jgi:hypothetical protein